ncbi:MAG: isoprenylcysteine carboxylmethyltransferase family protein [Bacteroidota bacterium]
MNELLRYSAGYAFGFTLFGCLIPIGLYCLSDADPITIPNISESLPIRLILSAPFFLTGIIFIVWSNISLLLRGKGGPAEGFGIAISPRTKNLVTTGPYRYSRNPMVFGAFCLYLSIGIFQMSILCIIVLLILLWLAATYILGSEKKRLLKDFGKDYDDYYRRTPGIIPGWKKSLVSGDIGEGNTEG